MGPIEGGTMRPVETGGATERPEPARGAAPAESPRPERSLLSSVCHDLKDPLASIVMGAGFLRRTLSPEDTGAQRVVEAIHRAAERMTRLIANFADLARLQANELTLDVRSDDVGASVMTAFDQFLPEATGQQVPVTIEVDAGLPQVPCDRARLVQALRQLGTCALRVVPDGGSIVMRAHREGAGQVRVEVAAKRPAGASTRRIVSDPPKPELAIARGMVELHGVDLAVAGDGDALTMSFVLPRMPP
jgi:signal transduction histidine kinase